MPQLSFHPGYSGGMLLVVAMAALLLTLVFYRRAFAALRPAQWMGLYLLRAAAIVIVLLLLFRPVFSIHTELTQRRHIVFAVDTSASMGIAEQAEGSSRLQQAVDHVTTWANELEDDFDTHLVAFAERAWPLEQSQQLAALRADGEVTSLSRALATATRIAPLTDVEAVFLLSDGIHNSAGDPLRIATTIGVPVHTVGVGNSLREGVAYRDARVIGLEVPQQMTVDNLARVKGYVEATGLPGRIVTVTLLENDLPVDEQELALDDAEGAQELTFEFTPTTTGLQTYTISLPPAVEERIAENNRRSTSALVIDARIRVLYLEGTLRAEYGALVGHFLSKDPNLEFCALVQTRPNVFLQRSNIDDLSLKSIPSPDQLASFDVFVVGDLDSSYFQAAQLEAIARRVREGGGLLMTGGYHSLGPGGYAETPLAELLPVFVGDRQVGQITDPFQPQLTPAGRQHPIFANIRDFFPTPNAQSEIEGLPPLEGCVRVMAAKPGASVLAVHPRELTQQSAMPVMAVQPVDQGRAAIFTADTTRHWHQALRAADRETPFLRFWGQTVRWLAGRSDAFETEPGVVVTTDKAHYEPEAVVTIAAVVRGPEGEAAGDARVSATVDGPADEHFELNLSALPGPAGNFRAAFEPQRSGHYEIVVAAQVAETRLTAEPVAIEVGRPNLEFDQLQLDEKMLTAISEATHGQYAHVTTADRLIDGLQRRQQRRHVQSEYALAQPFLLWTLFVGVITSEWLLRRKYFLR